jgi:hypothetical protein
MLNQLKAEEAFNAREELTELLAEAADRYGVEAPTIPKVQGKEQVDIALADALRDLALTKFLLAAIDAATSQKNSQKDSQTNGSQKSKSKNRD